MNRPLETRTSAILALCCVLSAAPGLSCLENRCETFFCQDFLAIEIEKESPWRAGDYEFDFDFDGEQVHCEKTLPYDPDRSYHECDDDVTSISGFVRADGRIEQGTALNQVSHLGGTPSRVHLTIRFESEILVDTTLEPEYGDTPNWDRLCGPPCDEAFVTISAP